MNHGDNTKDPFPPVLPILKHFVVQIVQLFFKFHLFLFMVSNFPFPMFMFGFKSVIWNGENVSANGNMNRGAQESS